MSGAAPGREGPAPTEGEGPPLPAYGSRSLVEITPSLLAALGGPGFTNPMDLGPARAACLLVVDGLGWDLLRDRRADAPFLAEALDRSRAASTAFPSTTVTSLSCIGTGLTPGRHGMVGYTVALPGRDRAVNLLRWAEYGPGSSADLREELPPERFQPHITAFERAARSGVDVVLVGPTGLGGTGLTRAVLRGGRYRDVYSMGDLGAAILDALRPAAGSPRLVYAYHADLDMTGHVRGVASDAWSLHLRHVDRMCESVVERLQADTALVVTGDHGMVDVDPATKVDVADHPDLLRGVRVLAGEPRARYVHTLPGRQSEVLARWRGRLGRGFWVRSREQAVAEGWFGPAVEDEAMSRIGDVIVAARGPGGVFDRQVEGWMASLIGYHGSLTDAERLVPLVEFRG